MGSLFPDLQACQRRITVDEYHRMIEAGILGADEHVQLISGTLVALAPQGSLHAQVIQRLNRRLMRAVGDDVIVRRQFPLTLVDSEPEPDLALVRADEVRSQEHHPRTALLVIEVAGESLDLDRQSKAALYARAAIPEYWIVNLSDSTVEVHREPDPTTGLYRAKAIVRGGETLSAASMPGLSLDPAELFS